MREERGRLAGDQMIDEPVELWGSIAGTVTVVDGGKFYVRGAIYGDVIVEVGGRVHIFGNVQGHVLVRAGAKLIHSGVIGGNLTNDGGRLLVERTAKVGGRIRTRSGKTKLEGKHSDNP